MAKKEGPTAQETALAQQSAAQWADYKSRYIPAELALIKKSEFTAGEQARVKGEVAGDTAAAFKGLARNTVASGEIAGAGVSSGKTKMSLAGNALAKGEATGVGQSVATTGGNIDSDEQKLKLTGLGRQIATDSTSDLSRGARRATGLALAASQAKFEKNQAMIDGVMTVAGAAAEKYRLNKGKKDLDLKADGQLWDRLDSGLSDFVGETDPGMRTMKGMNIPNPFDGMYKKPRTSGRGF